MRTLYNFVAIVIIAGIFIYSCGDDNPTSNNNNNGNPSTSETLRVSFDSLYAISGTSLSQFATSYVTGDENLKYRISFNVETNVDTCCPFDSSYLKVQSYLYPISNSTIVHLNKTREQIPGTTLNTTFTLKDTSEYAVASHTFLFGFSNSYPSGKFIKLKNVRIYSVH